MGTGRREILSIQSLAIGCMRGRRKLQILPPLNASACMGELVAVLGRNGIGKSTLLRSVAGLQKTLEGTVLINNEDSGHYSRLELARSVGYISTEIVRVSHMRVYDLVALGRFPYTDWTGRIDRRTDEIINKSINKAGLKDFGDRFISELSDGERQRAMIARVLAQDTDIMIMDEPLAFLDISGKFGIVKLMKELSSAGKTIVFSTHDFNIALNNADKIWLITNSNLIQGAPEDLWLANYFEYLFDSEHTGFNPEDGSFNFSSVKMGKLHIEGGTKRLRNWTVKALKRNGFDISDQKTTPYIRVLDGNDGWSLITNDEVLDFKTLYDLLQRLLQQSMFPI